MCRHFHTHRIHHKLGQGSENTTEKRRNEREGRRHGSGIDSPPPGYLQMPVALRWRRGAHSSGNQQAPLTAAAEDGLNRLRVMKARGGEEEESF